MGSAGDCLVQVALYLLTAVLLCAHGKGRAALIVGPKSHPHESLDATMKGNGMLGPQMGQSTPLQSFIVHNKVAAALPWEVETLSKDMVGRPHQYQEPSASSNMAYDPTLHNVHSEALQLGSAVGPYIPWASQQNKRQLKAQTHLPEQNSLREESQELSVGSVQHSLPQSSDGQDLMVQIVPLEYLRMPPEMETATPKPAATASPCTNETGLLPDPQDKNCYWICFKLSRTCCAAGQCFIPTSLGLGNCGVRSDS
jgi:hypothetical protein